jgi:hypothetical protein
MDRRQKRLEIEYTNFMNNIGDKSLAEYYQFNDTIHVQFTKLNIDEFELKIDYENKPPFIYELNLPNDVKTYIKSFLHEKLHLISTIKYKQDYPFSAPIFSLSHVETNFPNFYSSNRKTTRLNIFNNMYSFSWQPGISMEYNIFTFILFMLNI